MNLLEFREMKAREEAQKDTTVQTGTEVQPNVQADEGAVGTAQPAVQTETQVSGTPQTGGAEETPQSEPNQDEPTLFDVGGQKVTLDELQKGYLRQSDYTRKTQEVARREREIAQAKQLLSQIEANPELARQVGYNPDQARIQKMEAELFDLRLENEINGLSSKYADFNAQEVIGFALERKMENLEDAYLLNKQLNGLVPPNQSVVQEKPVDVETLKAQIRAEIMNELNTSTIITSQGTPPKQAEAPKLSEMEMRVARNMKMSPEDYQKWRDGI